MEREVASLLEREKRLVRLYTFGEIDEAAIREEGANQRRQREGLQDRLRTLAARTEPVARRIDRELLGRACAAVADWLDCADEQERILALEALQAAVATTKGQATVTGLLPIEPPEFSADERACRCTFLGDKPGAVSGVPFRVTIAL